MTASSLREGMRVPAVLRDFLKLAPCFLRPASAGKLAEPGSWDKDKTNQPHAALTPPSLPTSSRSSMLTKFGLASICGYQAVWGERGGVG